MHRITHNLSLKLISIFLAVVLWSHVRGEVNPLETSSVDVPLKALMPRHIVLMNGHVPDKVTVLLRGPRLSLRNIKGGALANPLAPTEQAPNVLNGAVSAALDFSRSRVGVQDVAIKATSNVADVDVMSVKPASITLTLDRARSLKLPVRIQFSPALGEGVSAIGAKANPGTVQAFGPSIALDRIVTVRARLDATTAVPGLQKTLRARLIACDRNGDSVPGIRLNPTSVRVPVLLREERISRSLPVIARVAGTPAAGYEIEGVEATPAKVEVQAPARILKTLKQMEATVNIDGISDSVRRRVTLALPSDVETTGSRAPRVTVEVRVKRIAAPKPANESSGTAGVGQAAPDLPLGLSGGSNPAESRGTARNGSARQNGSIPDEMPPPVRRGG